MPVLSEAPSTFSSGVISRRSCDCEPSSWPWQETERPAASVNSAVSAEGACGASDCHAARAALACDHGKVMRNQLACDTRCARSCRWVTIPKLPPPPPRQAQNRPGLLSASAVRTLPSAVTIWTARMLSQVIPNARPVSPIPPPSANPPRPTVGHEPPGVVAPWRASAAYRSIRLVPAPAVAVEPLSETPSKRRRSTIRPPCVVQ